MRPFIFIASFLLPTIGLNAQTFTLEDSTFRKGDVLIAENVLFSLSDSLYSGLITGFADSLVTFMKAHSSIEIEIGIHCDERRPNGYSSCLTCRRANMLREYLIALGAPAGRLKAKGYEDFKPIIVGAKTETEHQVNRRTEIKIIAID